jgi:hypothetical protein
MTELEFWANCIPEPNTGCWLWLGATKKDGGYPRVWFNGKYQKGHRVAWELANGETLGDRCALHKCDQPSCINPEHIFAGTQADNVADMLSKGRERYVGLPGEQNGRAKLTDAQVAALRADLANGMTQTAAAARYGISQARVSKIWRGEGWLKIDPTEGGPTC